MNQNCCQNCGIIIQLNYDVTQYHILCYTCIRSSKICSKTSCKKDFLLNDNDLKNIKMVYNNNYNYYLYTDIEKIIINKYGSILNLKKKIDQRNIVRNAKKNKSENLKTMRENKLKAELKRYKIEFKNHGNFYSYIHYGTPSLETIITDELKKSKEKMERRFILSNELEKLNIPLDETLKSCYEYINNLTNKSLPVIIRNIEVEHFLKYETDYDVLCSYYSEEMAQDIALKRYVNKQQLPLNIKTKYNKLSLDFK